MGRRQSQLKTGSRKQPGNELLPAPPAARAPAASAAPTCSPALLHPAPPPRPPRLQDVQQRVLAAVGAQAAGGKADGDVGRRVRHDVEVGEGGQVAHALGALRGHKGCEARGGPAGGSRAAA